MSPVFRHGRLRLYLLKLLDDAPKHGYEVIRLLQDRFMGVYAPSPGTIYPRLARLEEEGLVTHDEVDGRKVYRLTDKGRAEIRDRVDDLAELEEEISESVRDIAREVKEDVRETVRSLREEIARAARDVNRRPADDFERTREEARRAAQEAKAAKEQGQRAREEAQRAREEGGRSKQDATGGRAASQPDPDAWRQASDDAEDAGYGGHQAPRGDYEEAGARFRTGRGRGRKDWGDWSTLRDWPGWRDWPGLKDWPGWRDWPGGHDGPGQGRAPGFPDPARFRDLERMAIQFAAELRRVAASAGTVGEDAFGDLRSILEEALTRIRTEIFEHPPAEPGKPGPAEAAVSITGKPASQAAADGESSSPGASARPPGPESPASQDPPGTS